MAINTTALISHNQGAVLGTIAQFFGAMMNLTAQILEHEAKLDPLQVIFDRMSITLVISVVYMWWTSTPGFPLGHVSVRRLLVARGIFGFLGVYGIWSSLMYLDLGEATILTFLTPSVSAYACHVLLHERFTMVEQFLGACGFIPQFLLTTGLRSDKTNRATMAIYTQMVFAVTFGSWFFGKVMDWITCAACSMIIGSAMWVTLTKNEVDKTTKKEVADFGTDLERQGLLEGGPMRESRYRSSDPPM